MKTFISNLKLVGTIIILTNFSSVIAQSLCPLDGEDGDEGLEVLSSASCSGTATYPILAEDFMPVSSTILKAIKLKFIVVQNPNIYFNGNFESSDETDKFFNDAMADCNLRYANISTGSLCVVPDPSDMYIQFNLSMREYYADYTTVYWDNPTSGGESTWCPGGNNWDLDPIMSEPLEYLNVFFTEDGCNVIELLYGTPCAEGPADVSCSEFPSYADLDKISRVNIRGSFAKYYDLKVNGDTGFPGTFWDAEATSYDPVNRYWWIVQTLGKSLAHELGHSLDLRHNVDCDETHVMNPSGGNPRTYFNEEELGIANRSLYLSSVR